MLYNKHVVAAIYVFNGTKCLLKLKKLIISMPYQED